MTTRNPRSAKSGSDFDVSDMDAYNITFKAQNFVDFFGMQPPALQPIQILQYETAQVQMDQSAFQVLRALDLATQGDPPQESRVDTFASKLLLELGYASNDSNRDILVHEDLSLVICGETRKAKTDVCIRKTDGEEVYLLVQENKRYQEQKDARPQLVAEAIAAFQENNSARARRDIPALKEELIPCIIMVRMSPTFYKVKVTENLSMAVKEGQFPKEQTIVYEHLPTIPRPLHRLSEGMKEMDNRKAIITCFEAFKIFLPVSTSVCVLFV